MYALLTWSDVGFLGSKQLHTNSYTYSPNALMIVTLIRFVGLYVGVVVLLVRPIYGQEAQDRGTDDISATIGNMMADSPVDFSNGVLPSKYPPDVTVWREPVEENYRLFGSPCRSLQQIETIQRDMPSGEFTPPRQDWRNLTRTRRILTEGGELHILALGDSIMNDTMRSGWVAKLAEAHRKARIHATCYLRNGGGCHHFLKEGRLAKHVVPRKPDLIFIGGISQGGHVANIRKVVEQTRDALPNVEFLLATGAFGTRDPRSPEAMAQATYTGSSEYGAALKQLAVEQNCAYLDMTTPWAEYIRSAKVHPHLYYRDPAHANEFGEQILSKILMAFFGDT